MPTKTILSSAQRTVIFDPPVRRVSIELLYTLGPDVLAQVARCRRGTNRIDCRTLDDYQLPMPAFEAMRVIGNLRLAVPTDFPEWHEERRMFPTRRITTMGRAVAAGELVDVTIKREQFLISPIWRFPFDDAAACPHYQPAG